MNLDSSFNKATDDGLDDLSYIAGRGIFFSSENLEINTSRFYPFKRIRKLC
jgi:hypothetical protein